MTRVRPGKLTCDSSRNLTQWKISGRKTLNLKILLKLYHRIPVTERCFQNCSPHQQFSLIFSGCTIIFSCQAIWCQAVTTACSRWVSINNRVALGFHDAHKDAWCLVKSQKQPFSEIFEISNEKDLLWKMLSHHQKCICKAIWGSIHKDFYVSVKRTKPR